METRLIAPLQINISVNQEDRKDALASAPTIPFLDIYPVEVNQQK